MIRHCRRKVRHYEKILIEVVCAATAKSYEFLLPAQMSVGVARKKIIEQIIAYEENEDLFQGTETILFVIWNKKRYLMRNLH